MSKVSIIVATYNRQKYISLAIESILAQSFSDWEMIVADDSSQDSTRETIDHYLKDTRIKYYFNEQNLGISKNRNKALKMCQGKYIAVLDSDDLWFDKGKLAKQVDFLENNPDYGLIGTGIRVIDGHGNIIKEYHNPETDKKIRESILLRNPFVHSSAIFRKDLVDKLGGYEESFKIGEDYAMWLRLGRLCKMANLPGIYTAYRVHGHSICVSDKISGAKNTWGIIKKYHNDYPNYFWAMLKSYLRILKAYLGL